MKASGDIAVASLRVTAHSDLRTVIGATRAACLPVHHFGREYYLRGAVADSIRLAGAHLGETAVAADESRTRAARKQAMLALLDRVHITREQLRAKYGEFDVDAMIEGLRRERMEYLEGDADSRS